MSHKDNQSYYDEFSGWYEKHRHDGYHALIDALETDLVVPLAADQRVLEVGCGTGLILRHLEPIAKLAVGIDISPGMLERAQSRGLNVVRGSATHLPFENNSFDVVYSFKVLSHVEDIDRAFDEMARVTAPGGRLVLEFYNPHSLRYLSKRVWSGRISKSTTEAAVYTRFDSLRSLRERLPSSLRLDNVSGVRVLTPHAALHRVPLVRDVMAQLEWKARDSFLRYFGGFLVLHLTRL